MRKHFPFFLFLFLFGAAAFLRAQEDPREKSHSIVILPFVAENEQRYFLSWASSSGSIEGAWQHDIYKEVIRWNPSGVLSVVDGPVRFIGNGRDEAQEPVSAALNPKTNTILSVWEDGSGSSVDVRGELHTPDGTVLRKNYLIAGGPDSQHSPKVAQLDGHFLVVYTDEGPPAQFAMIRALLLNDSTGQIEDSLSLTSPNDDNWWPVVASTGKEEAFVGWGNGEAFSGRMVTVSAVRLQAGRPQTYFEDIDQYFYSLICLDKIGRFLAAARSGSATKIALIDTIGRKTAEVGLPAVGLTCETQLAAHWEIGANAYTIAFPANFRQLLFLQVRQNEIRLWRTLGPKEVSLLQNITWPTTGIACAFARSTAGADLSETKGLLFCAFNDLNSNDAVLLPIFCRSFLGIEKTIGEKEPRNFSLTPAFPNPFWGKTIIRFALSHSSVVTVRVYNLAGEDILLTRLGILEPGRHRFVWDGRNARGKKVASGIYFIQIAGEGRIGVQKVLLLKNGRSGF